MFDPTGMAQATTVQFAARASTIDPLQHWEKIHGDAILQNPDGPVFVQPLQLPTPSSFSRRSRLLERLVAIRGPMLSPTTGTAIQTCRPPI